MRAQSSEADLPLSNAFWIHLRTKQTRIDEPAALRVGVERPAIRPLSRRWLGCDSTNGSVAVAAVESRAGGTQQTSCPTDQWPRNQNHCYELLFLSYNENTQELEILVSAYQRTESETLTCFLFLLSAFFRVFFFYNSRWSPILAPAARFPSWIGLIFNLDRKIVTRRFARI